MRILTVPADSESLRSISEPVQIIDAQLIRFLKKLGETLKNQHDPQGVGLSAIQVGKPIRAFALLLPDRPKSKPQSTFYLNPEIIDHPEETTLGENLTKNRQPFMEGCLSIPRVYGPVRRWPSLTARALVLSEKNLSDPQYSHSTNTFISALLKSNFKLADLAARVFQHELDHLCGILFTDHTLAEGGDLYQENGDSLEQLNM